MPGNIVKINNSKWMEWYVGDSKMKWLLFVLKIIGIKQNEKIKYKVVEIEVKDGVSFEGKLFIVNKEWEFLGSKGRIIYPINLQDMIKFDLEINYLKEKITIEPLRISGGRLVANIQKEQK